MNELKILLIDDDEDTCSGIAALLQLPFDEYVFNLKSCKSYEESLKYNLDNFDLIILDMILPDKMGDDLFQEIYSKTNKPIIILSGYPNLAVQAAKSGAQSYITKPTTREVLVQNIVFSLEKWKLKKELEKKERMLRCAFDFNRDIIYIVNDEKIIDFNRSFGKKLSYSRNEKGKILDETIWENKELRKKFIEELKKHGQLNDKEYKLLTSSDKKLFCLVSAYIQEDEVYYFVHDLTKEKKFFNLISKSNYVLNNILQSKIETWKNEEEVRVSLRNKQLNDINCIIEEIKTLKDK